MAGADMSQHQMFRRVPVPAQLAQKLQTTTLPAPIRGLIESENLAFSQPGGAVLLDNWIPTMRSLKLRGGCKKWCDLYDDGVNPVPPSTDPSRTPIISAFEYASGNVQKMFAGQQTKLWDVT